MADDQNHPQWLMPAKPSPPTRLENHWAWSCRGAPTVDASFDFGNRGCPWCPAQPSQNHDLLWPPKVESRRNSLDPTTDPHPSGMTILWSWDWLTGNQGCGSPPQVVPWFRTRSPSSCTRPVGRLQRLLSTLLCRPTDVVSHISLGATEDRKIRSYNRSYDRFIDVSDKDVFHEEKSIHRFNIDVSASIMLIWLVFKILAVLQRLVLNFGDLN